MSFLRPISKLRTTTLRPTAVSVARQARLQQVRFATSDYGSGDGNPAGETPEKQGKNPSESLEHPGPPPPKVAEGQSSSSPDTDSSAGENSGPNPTSESPAPSTSSKGSSSGKREFSTSARQLSQEEKAEPAVVSARDNKPNKDAMKNAKPKILSEKPPAKGEESEDVKKHNEQMEHRHDKSDAKEGKKDEEVSKDFWKG